MRLFNCHTCDQVLFFENSTCVSCGSSVAYSPEVRDFVSLSADDPDAAIEIVMPGGKAESFRRCKNFAQQGACNWLVLESEGQPYCLSCRLTEIIPDQSDASNRTAWVDIERAKRR